MALLSEYGFTEGSGSTAADTSGNSHTLTAANSSTAWNASGKNGAGATTKFTGTVGANSSLTSFTIMFWIKRTGTWSGFAGLITKQADNLFFECDASNSYIPSCYGGTMNATAATALSLNTWTHLAYTQTGGVGTIYINGTASGATSTGSTAKNFGTGPWYILPAAGEQAEDSAFVGVMDEARFFDTALSTSQIQAYMYTPVGSSPAATKVKTVEYAFPMTTSVVTDAVVTNLTQITAYIPETVVAFRSVMVDIGFQDVITATGGTVSEHRCGLRLGSASYSTVTELDDITHSGENLGGVIGMFDFTSYFISNWSGSSMTCDVQVYFDQNTGTTLGMRNVTAILYITYEYDDTPATNANQLKTVHIPLESLTGALPTTANSNLGTNQIPQLTGAGGLLPEDTVTIRDYYFVIEGNEANNNTTTDWTITANIDSGSSSAFGAQEAGLASDRYCRWIYKPAVATTTSAHNLQLWSSVANKGNHLAITMVVTYQFTASASTTILNSIMLPITMVTPTGVTSSAEASRFSQDFFIEEPTTITLKQSAFRINLNSTASISGLSWRANSQSYRTYAHSADVVCGMFCLQQRIDSGGEQGAGITLARGKNTVTIDGYTSDTTDPSTNVNGILILNYHSGKATAGIGSHSTTTLTNQLSWDAALPERTRVDNYILPVPETSYYINGLGFIMYQWSLATSMAIALDVECLSTEGKGGGYYAAYTDGYRSDGKCASSIIWANAGAAFKRYPADPANGRLDIEAARDYILYTTPASSNGMIVAMTRHSITYTVSGTISGSAGGTVTINTYRSDTKEVVNTTSRSGNGTYSFTWYDNTINLYSEAYEDATHYGRSASATAGTTLDISLATGGGGVQVVGRAYA